jgi:hypothetical protein
MEIALTTPVEKLVPALIAWNNKELLAEVNKSLSKYRGKVYTEDMMKEAKADIATLRKFSKAITAERINIKKTYCAPLDKFTEEVAEVITAVDSVVGEIDKVISDYEEGLRTAKRESLQAYFNETIGDLADLVAFEKIEDKRWMNASVSEKNCKKEIDDRVAQIRADVGTIKSLGRDDVDTVLAYYFKLLSLNGAISQANEMNKAKDLVGNVSKEQQTTKQENTANQTNEKIYTISFKVSTTASKLSALSSYMKENGIAFSRV